MKSRAGIAGKRLRFEHDEGKIPDLYHVTVFVTPKRIDMIEMGGTKDFMLASAAVTDATIAAFVAD